MNRFLPLLLLAGLPAVGSTQNCQNTSIGETPINDLATGSYQGFQGGLYPNGLNLRPAAHESAGLAQSALIVPRDAQGAPDPLNGSIGLVSIGMSNTAQEWGVFMTDTNNDPDVNPRLVLIQGAQGGQPAEVIKDPNAAYWTRVDQQISRAGLTPLQVQAVWFKQAHRGPTDPFPQHAQELRDDYETIMNIIRSRYPNVRAAYCSSRIYAGYAVSTLNPEPFAYESGFSVKWMIENQVNGAANLNFDPGAGPVNAPWISWAAYTWADGLRPRSDGLIWECSDLGPDGTHPSQAGRQKVADLLTDFFKHDSTTRSWFLANGGPGPIVLSQTVLRAGLNARSTVRDAQAGERVFFLHSATGTGAGPCSSKLGGLCLDILKPISITGSAIANNNGTAQLDWIVPTGVAMLHTQAVIQRGAGHVDSVKSNFISAPVQ